MKRIVSLVILTLLSLPVIAATETVPDSLSMKINFVYTMTNLKGKSNQYIIANDLDMSTSNHDWTIVQNDEERDTPSRLILLGRVNTASATQATINFIVIDTENNAQVISKPEVVVHYGEAAKIAFKNNKSEMSLSIMADA